VHPFPIVPANSLSTTIRAYGDCALRWLVQEFLIISTRPNLVSMLTSLCRLLGCTTIFSVTRVVLRNGFAVGGLAAMAQCCLAVLLGVLLGNLSKEAALSVCESLMNWCGQDFWRSGITLDGRAYGEIRYANGTWIRCESGRDATACEWTDVSGACYRLESAPLLYRLFRTRASANEAVVAYARQIIAAIAEFDFLRRSGKRKS
jgi:hypothetical protein